MLTYDSILVSAIIVASDDWLIGYLETIGCVGHGFAILYLSYFIDLKMIRRFRVCILAMLSIENCSAQ